MARRGASAPSRRSDVSEANQQNRLVVPALTVRQPWAWLIIHGGKDIENRRWKTNVRGRVLIHAAKGMTRNEYYDAWDYADDIGVEVPDIDVINLQRGCIIGSVEIVDCVSQCPSPWFMGPYGFVLRDPQILPHESCRGALGFWKYNGLAQT
jgi:hypothetical protein